MIYHVYNKNTYIGHLKIKNGGMKIIKDEHDKLIGKERNIVLKHLHDSLKGGNLDHTNIELYYKALEGGFIRALMCPGNNNDATCELANYNNEKSAYKLSKHALKGGNLKVLKTFKHNAPKLYQHLKGSGQIKKLKYKRDKYQNRLSDGGSVKSDSSLSEHLSNLRNNVGTRNLNETGGDIGIPRSVLENQLQYAKKAREWALEKTKLLNANETLKKEIKEIEQAWEEDTKYSQIDFSRLLKLTNTTNREEMEEAFENL